MLRSKCVICNSDDIEIIYTLHDFPICRYSSESIKSDKTANLEYGCCTQCGCLQLLTLQDPNVLYKENNNQTFATTQWINHHKLFAEFIVSNVDTPNVITEIGGTTGFLAKEILNQKNIKYNIIDLCETDPNIPGVTFINDNAENRTFTQNEVVIMSHVFEHVYSPRDFILKMWNAEVNDIFISIPDMKTQLEKRVMLFINVEHTFYCDIDFCLALFSSIGYTCKQTYNFNSHSIFFHFVRDKPINFSWNILNPIRQTFIKYFNEIEQSYKELVLEKPYYIAPAGYYCQWVYYLLDKYRHTLHGVLDNDPKKEGLRICGTNHIILNPKILKYEISPTVLLSSTMYLDDIMQAFLEYNSKIIFIIV